MSGPALRGEVWSCALPQPIGPHPVVILASNRIAERLSAVTVAVIIGTEGPAATHVTVGPDSGLKKYDQSFVNCTDLHTVAKPRLRRRLGLLGPAEMGRLDEALGLILGLRR